MQEYVHVYTAIIKYKLNNVKSFNHTLYLMNAMLHFRILG